MSLRIQRVNELLRKEMSQLLLKEIDFDQSMVTITEVDTSPDLRQAKIKISVLPEKSTEAVLKRLEKNIFDLQQQLNKKLNMRPVPKLRFVIDKASIKEQRVEELLQKIKIEEKP